MIPTPSGASITLAVAITRLRRSFLPEGVGSPEWDQREHCFQSRISPNVSVFFQLPPRGFAPRYRGRGTAQ
jgi:hypothetical protein